MSQALKKEIPKVRGAEILLQALLEQGVDTIFGYPGGAIMPVYDALADYTEELRHILVRHEQGAAHAAEGYARATGRAGVCMATSGPGATNLVTGIADAMMDSIPLVCITGQVASALLGTDAFQETDVIGITIPITKWNYQVTRAEEIPEVIAKAFSVAQTGRPGPVLVDITKDAQVHMIEQPIFQKFTPRRKDYSLRSEDLSGLSAAADLINQAQKPLLLVGHGVIISHAEAEVLALMEKAEIPAACTLHGLSAIPSRHPMYVGMLGMHGNYAPNMLTNEADLLIAVGMRFDDRVTGDLKRYAPQAKILHIEVDPAEVHKNKRAEVALIADARRALREILPLVEKAEHGSWRSAFARYEQQEREQVIDQDICPNKAAGHECPIRMSEAVHRLSEITEGDAIVVADVGQHQMMAARYFRFARSNSFMSSGGLGTMGFALPAAMGVQVAVPQERVLAIIGDGGFQMTLQELATIAQENVPVKIVILNNEFLGMVRQWQELFFERRYSSVDMKNPDFIAITKGFGIPAERVMERGELDGAIERMLKTQGPALLEIVVEKEANVFPMISTGSSVCEMRLK